RSRIDVYFNGDGRSPLSMTVLLKGRKPVAPTVVRQPQEVIIKGYLGRTAQSDFAVITHEKDSPNPWVTGLDSDAHEVLVTSLDFEDSPGPDDATVERTYQFRLTAALSSRGRKHLATLTARCAAPAGGAAMSLVTVMSDCAASVEAVPDTVFVSVKKSELPMEFLVRFRSPSLGRSLKIEPKTEPRPWFHLDAPTVPAQSSVFGAEIKVHILDLPDVEGGASSRAVITVATNAPDCPEVVIPLFVHPKQ
ncbi:MAG TPA: hypothetical protein PK867_28500, partial [Pirellulales bacterium]|nr:hypothetical protein [Pirellulales bacterium]